MKPKRDFPPPPPDSLIWIICFMTAMAVLINLYSY